MVFKCKMCGGDIEVIQGTNVGKCLYCKSTMTLPNIENEKILNLYNRANNLRLSNDFDKAYAIYEMILELNEEEIEAHWGLILCKYGVEYVDDPKTKKKIITCHRTRYESVLTDPDYKFIMSKSYGEAKEIYTNEASVISDIQKKSLEISSSEEPYDIFICYKETDENGNRTKDSVLAEDIYNRLTELNYKVFFARKTLENKLGIEYEPYIFSALNSSKVMLVVGTSTDNLNSVWVKNEWSRYLDLIKKERKNKTLIPVYKDIDAYELPEEFSMLQAQSMDKVGAIQDLLSGIGKIVKISSKNEIDEEMYEKFKKMMEEDKRKQQEKLNSRYEVSMKTESVGVKYILITFALSFIMAIFMLYAYDSKFIFNSSSSFSLPEAILYGIGPSFIQIIICIITFIAFFLGFVSRKTNKVSKYLYFINILLESIYAISLYCINYKLNYQFYVILVLNIILFLIKPKWRIKENICLVSEEEKKEILEENKILMENFVEKEKNLIKKPFYIIIILMIVIISIFSFLPIKGQGNDRNYSLDQVEVISDYIKLRSSPELYNSRVIGIVNKGEIYTYYDVVKEETYSNNITWYKIKTSTGISGYIAGNSYDDIYLKILEKDAN